MKSQKKDKPTFNSTKIKSSLRYLIREFNEDELEVIKQVIDCYYGAYYEYCDFKGIEPFKTINPKESKECREQALSLAYEFIAEAKKLLLEDERILQYSHNWVEEHPF